MMLEAGYHGVGPGRIAVAVTFLEMLARPPERPGAPPPAFAIRAVPMPDVAWYRDLFRRVGSDWLWASRLRMSDAELGAIIGDPSVSVLALAGPERDEGLLELDFREPGACELSFFGVTAPLIGTGAARQLMNRAVAEAWARPIRRFWVHTCTGDHPKALGFYVRSGFVPYEMQVEIADDPRLTGLLPETVAPHVPLIRSTR